MEVEHLLIPLSNGLHLTIRLISNTVVDVQEVRHWHESIEDFALVMSLEARHERACVAIPLHKCVNRVAVCLHAGDDDLAVLVLQGGWLAHAHGTTLDSFVVDASCIVYCEGDILHTVSVLGVMSRELWVVWLKRRREGVRDLVVADDVRAELTVSSLQALLKCSQYKVKRQKY